MKFTKEHQKKLELSDATVQKHKDEGATGVIAYESSQMFLDKWTLCYTTFHPGSLARVMGDMSQAVTEGRVRNPMALEF